MKNFNLDAILEAMLKMSDRVSDLNFSVGRQPQVEIDGALTPVNFPGLPRLTPYQTEMIALNASYAVTKYLTAGALASFAANQSNHSVFDYQVGDIGGAVTFWSLADWSNRDRLQSEFSALGLNPFIPEPRRRWGNPPRARSRAAASASHCA